MKREDTHALPDLITSHHLRQSPMMHESASRNCAMVPRGTDDALRMDLVIRRHGGAEDGRFSASARVPLPGRDLRATAVHSDLHIAIVKLFERLVRRSHIRKARPRNSRTTRHSRKRASGHERAESFSAANSGQAHSERRTVREFSCRDSQISEGAKAISGHSPAHVLLAIDYTKTSAAVTRTAAALADKAGARLTLLHVMDPVALNPSSEAHWIDVPRQRRHYELARLQSWSRDHASMGHPSCSVIEGQPWEQILRFAEASSVDLIVMGRSGSRWFGRLTARTVERVAQNSKCPVLIVGQDQEQAPFEPRRVLLTTDFSANSLEAFPWAERISRRFGAQILLVNVQDPMALPESSAYADFHQTIDGQRKQADKRLEVWRHAHLASDLHVDIRVTEGVPALSLCRLVESHQTDLVVMSTHGTKGWTRKWLGGTTEGVLRNVTCSVLVVPPGR